MFSPQQWSLILPADVPGAWRTESSECHSTTTSVFSLSVKFSHVERVWFGSLLSRVASMSVNSIFHCRGSGGVGQGQRSIQTGHSSFVQQQGTAFHLRLSSLFCDCVCSSFLQRGAVLPAVGLARGYFFFCNKGLILDHTISCRLHKPEMTFQRRHFNSPTSCECQKNAHKS